MKRQTPIVADLRFYHPVGADVKAVFDWREDGDQIWVIGAVTDAGTLLLREGCARLLIDGTEA